MKQRVPHGQVVTMASMGQMAGKITRTNGGARNQGQEFNHMAVAARMNGRSPAMKTIDGLMWSSATVVRNATLVWDQFLMKSNNLPRQARDMR